MVRPFLSSSRYSRGREDATKPAVFRFPSRNGWLKSSPWRIETVVTMPAFLDELFPQDIAMMLNGRLTFKDAIESPALSLMSRHRLK
jgi:hypothetical protein